MANEAGDPPGGKGFWPDWITPRRIWEFVTNVARLERSVQHLETENVTLRSEVARLHEVVTAHEAQLRLLTTFVRDSLSNRLEARIEKLAADLLADREKRK